MSCICLTIGAQMNNPNDLLVMVLEGLIRDMDKQSLKEKNHITALKLGIITWSEFLEFWGNKQASSAAPNHKAPRKAA